MRQPSLGSPNCALQTDGRARSLAARAPFPWPPLSATLGGPSMAAIDARHIDKLRAASLVVSEPFLPDHSAFPEGVIVGKPATVQGHSLPDYETLWVDAEGRSVSLDAPVVYLHGEGRCWYVTSHDSIPSPGVDDFVTTWGTPEEAVLDILDFFFGAPYRMDAKRRRWTSAPPPRPEPLRVHMKLHGFAKP